MNKEICFLVLSSFKEQGEAINKQLMLLNNTEKSFIIPLDEIRFQNGEGKIVISDSIRNQHVFIFSDIGNHSCTYKIYDYYNHMSPDDHFQDVKRVISAIKCHAQSITIVMPLLYSSRQHKRHGRESLDCPDALRELEHLGVDTIITFDAHDPNVQGSISHTAFENFYASFVLIDSFLNSTPNINNKHTLVIAPDAGAIERASFYSSILNTPIGMFNKRRDPTKIKDGKSPIISHDYLGPEVSGNDCIIIDDMIASGGSILDVISLLKERGANNIYIISTFAFFNNGIDNFDKFYKKHFFSKVISTNLTYTSPIIKKRKWYVEADCSKYLAEIINNYQFGKSISPFLNNGESKFILKETLQKKYKGFFQK